MCRRLGRCGLDWIQPETMRMFMTMKTKSEKSKSLYVSLDPSEHGVLRIEAAVTGWTIGDIVRNRLIVPLRKKHEMLLRRSGGDK